MDNTGIFIAGIEAGIQHLDHLDPYYCGLNNHIVEYDPLAKDFSISATGVLSKLSEEPLDRYMRELVDELRSGLRDGNKKQHIESIFKKFSDRKTTARDWWQALTEDEINELLSGIRSYWTPHTAMLNEGLADAFMFGKFSKMMNESTSLSAARKKIAKLGMSKFDQARVDAIQKTAGIFWDKAISRETDGALMKILAYNRDVTTKILENPGRKSWRSLTTDIYNSINKDERLVMRDLERITLTELANAQNSAVLVSAHERGAEYFIVRSRPTACKKCKEMYQENGKPKKFRIADFLTQPRDINWGKRKGDRILDQPPPLHSHCFCKIFVLG